MRVMLFWCTEYSKIWKKELNKVLAVVGKYLAEIDI